MIEPMFGMILDKKSTDVIILQITRTSEMKTVYGEVYRQSTHHASVPSSANF